MSANPRLVIEASAPGRLGALDTSDPDIRGLSITMALYLRDAMLSHLQTGAPVPDDFPPECPLAGGWRDWWRRLELVDDTGKVYLTIQ